MTSRHLIELTSSKSLLVPSSLSILLARANAETSEGGCSLLKALADDRMTGSSLLVYNLAAIHASEYSKLLCSSPGCCPSQAVTAIGSSFVGSSSAGKLS